MAPSAVRQVVFASAIAGIVVGVAYTLSPSTVLALAMLSVVIAWAGAGLSPRQRRWFLSIVVVAVTARLAVIAGLFLTADPALPFATLFGDEQFFKNRTVWMRNIGLGLPMSPADIIYAFEDVGRSSYLYVLAFLQALIGTVPYGIHVLNAAVYLIGVVLVYRLVRPVYGGVAALAGLALLLFFPSLFVWSISALKEPSYTLVAVIELLCALYIVRGRLWWHRALAVAGVIAAAFALDSLRRGGLAVSAVGTLAGLALGLTASRPRLGFAALVAVPAVVVALWLTPPIHDRVLQVVRRSAVYHGGHITSEGYSYKILDPPLLLGRAPFVCDAAARSRRVRGAIRDQLRDRAGAMALGVAGDASVSARADVVVRRPRIRPVWVRGGHAPRSGADQPARSPCLCHCHDGGAHQR